MCVCVCVCVCVCGGGGGGGGGGLIELLCMSIVSDLSSYQLNVHLSYKKDLRKIQNQACNTISECPECPTPLLDTCTSKNLSS